MAWSFKTSRREYRRRLVTVRFGRIMSRCSYIIRVLGCVSRISEATLSVKIGLSRAVPASRPAGPPAGGGAYPGFLLSSFLLVLRGVYTFYPSFCHLLWEGTFPLFFGT